MPEDPTVHPFPDDRFIRAFTESQSALRGFCAASIGNQEDARDVFQKVCLVLWKKVGDWDPDTPFLKWAFAVARFEVLAYVRDKSRDRLVFDEDVVLAMTNTTERLAGKQIDRRDALEKCLAKLRPDHREALTAHYAKGYNFQEIAEQQNRGLSAVKVMMMRSRQSLGKCIENQLAIQS